MVLALAGWAAAGGVAVAETQVTTYIVKVQEERENTRWTLTEWLRIKERMKMMDVWLAMFSDPKKDKFQPELALSYGLTRGTYQRDSGTGDAASTRTGSLSGSAGKAQLWLTNIISSTIGVRTLNIDLGGEYYRRQTGELALTGASAAAGADAPAIGHGLTSQYYTGDLRIFGRNVQDSSLVLKYGRYVQKNAIFAEDEDAAAWSPRGAVAGAELQLYFFRWLGAEGNYLAFGDSSSAQGSAAQKGTYYDYLAYIEISLLRLQGGLYQEEWTMRDANDGEGAAGTERKTVEKGSIAGVKLQF
jgi:hypothetical protein